MQPKPDMKPEGRVCAICGRPGGTPLRMALLDYAEADGTLKRLDSPYAHPNCFSRGKKAIASKPAPTATKA